MENLRWWLLLIAAVMFSMSGCAFGQEWASGRDHSTHFASGQHMSLLDPLRRGEGTLPGAEGPVVMVLVRQR
jgi:hypothetical protein